MKLTNLLDAGGFRLTQLADGTAAQDAITKAQLDAAIQGYKWKEPVRAATTAAITLSGVQTIDGVSIAIGDRVLVKNQASGASNGIYVAASGAWTRATDFDASNEILGASAFISEGSTQGNQVWVMTTDGPIAIGATVLSFTQVGAGTSYTAGNGINISGGAILVDPTVVNRKASAAIGDGSSTTLTMTHSLNTKDVVVSVREVSTDSAVLVDWVASTVNTIQLTFGTAPSTGQYRVTVTG